MRTHIARSSVELADTLTDCSVSLVELAEAISLGALTLSDEDQRLLYLMANCLGTMARGEPVTAWWRALSREVDVGPLDGRDWWMAVYLARKRTDAMLGR